MDKNVIDLHSCRQLLGLSIEEAATKIGLVSYNDWVAMEKGIKPIPNEISQTVKEVLAWIDQKRIECLDEYRIHFDDKIIVALSYDNPDDLIDCDSNPFIYFRANQSLCAELQTMGLEDSLKTVRFDRKSYDEWRQNKVDSEDLRRQWARWIALKSTKD
jgi:hypothetical protein